MSAVPLRIEDLPHYTYEDYAKWEGKWEIINGVPYAMVPCPAMKHQRLGVKIIRQLDVLLDDCPKCKTYLPVDWKITEDTVVQPDVLVVCDVKGEGIILESAPVIIFEILSPSTSHKDKGIKYNLYETAGVKYYCIVDPKTESAEVFLLQKDKYKGPDAFKAGKMLFDLAPCQIEFDFGKIFKE